MAEEVNIDLQSPAAKASLARYWKKNVRCTIFLLVIWAIAGLGCGILFADKLNEFKFMGSGYPLGFWFAQQGSIMVFVLVILAYCIFMNRLDASHHKELMNLPKRDEESS